MKKILLPTLVLLAACVLWMNFSDGAKRKLNNSEEYLWIKEGDILFQDMNGDFGEAIKLATHSKFSHCGMVLKRYNELMVYEAVGPVKYTPLKEWIKHGNKSSFTVKRLIDEKAINAAVVSNWNKKADIYSGKQYDHVFGWNDDKIYCSELVWKMYKNGLNIELSSPKKLKDFDLSHALVKQQLALRYGTKIPYEENVVSPQDLFDSKLLKEVKM